MKKLLLYLLFFTLVFSLCSCSLRKNPLKEQTVVESSLQTGSDEESLPPEVSDNSDCAESCFDSVQFKLGLGLSV
jgi:hypothetical protein